ncbi:hypothetical protein [Demequina aurantiaca]|uniref:hypothetical protein n=1 Tax=Demequina aurantiaca TaxID=676200 RepID=UPI003D32DFAC
MSLIAMDPEAMAHHVRLHQEATDAIGEKLLEIPAAVDGGLASDSIAAIMMRVGVGVDALYRINGTLGEVVASVASDSDIQEQDVIDQLAAVTAELEDLS